MSYLNWFWELTDEEIYNGICLRNGSKEFNRNDLTYKYAWEPGFLRLADMWAQADGDRLMMKLQYADDIAEIGVISAIGRIRFIPQNNSDQLFIKIDDVKKYEGAGWIL